MNLLFALFLSLQFAPSSPDLPNRQPDLAALGRQVALVYGAGDAIYVRMSLDAGRSFGDPVLVPSHGKLALGARRGPRVALTSGAILVAAVTGEKGRGADGDLYVWRSSDGGRTWSEGQRINDVPGSAREGLHGMAAAANGLVFVTWLDLRVKGTRLYGAVSLDGGLSWSPNVQVYESPSGSICQCCHPTVAVDDSGQIAVLFRNLVDGARDMYLIRSHDFGETFGPAAKLGSGTWLLNACPMDGGDLKLGRHGTAVAVWRREMELYTLREGGEEEFLGNGRNAVVALAKAGPVFVWSAGKGLKIRKPESREAETLAEPASDATLVSLPDGGVLGAWEHEGSIVVSRLN